jgi:acetate kinase
VVETSMGMTPLEGVMMWTRSGNIDSAIIPYLMKHESLTVDQVMDMLNKESGVLWISWVSNDMRDIYVWINEWNNRCQLALDMYINSLIKYIWSYAAILGGVDAIVLTGGVVEHKALIRKLLLQQLSWMWITLDEESNPDEISETTRISTSDSKIGVFVIPTNEELMIAEEIFRLIKK